MKLAFSRFFKKYSNIKFNKNPCSGSRVVLCGQKDTTKTIVAFRNFANAPNTQQSNLRQFNTEKEVSCPVLVTIVI